MDPGKHKNWTGIGSNDQLVASLVNTELRLEFGLWTETTLTPDLEILMDQTNSWLIQTTTTQKFLKISLKNKRYNWMWRILHADQRQKQNRKEENLLVIHRASFRWLKESGLTLNQENLLSLRTRFRRKWSIFFYSLKQYNERTTERFNSGESKNYLQNQFPQVIYWSDDRWKVCLAAEGGAKRIFQYCTDVSGIIILCPSSSRTFRTQYYWSFITRQCDNSEWILPSYLPYWMCVQSSLYHQQWINTWRSEFKQETNSNFFAYWSQRLKAQRSWTYWLLCTTSCTIPT